MSKKLTIRIIIGVLIVLIGIQFIRPSRKVPQVDPNGGFLMLESPPAEIASLLKTACYDCHSYETEYPWYASVAPVSWLVANHISEGREHLNFSDWGKYPSKKRLHKMEEANEEVAEGHMPESSYTWLHAGARLTDAQREALAAYFEETRNNLRSIPPMPTSSPAIPR